MTEDTRVPEPLLDFLGYAHFWVSGPDGITVECNHCSIGDYVFQEAANPDAKTWFPAMLAHVMGRHPDGVRDLLEPPAGVI